MKSAEAILKQLVLHVRPPAGCAIVLTETKSTVTGDNSATVASIRDGDGATATITPLENVRLSDTDRLEAFSDGVFAITITLLVIDIIRPEYQPGRLWERLVEQWPNYVAFLASFFYVGIIWLNHRAVFSRVRFCDRSLHLANLVLLLTSGLIPFPTALLSVALQRGTASDAIVAVEIYAAIGASMCLSWLALFHILVIHPYLQEDHVEPTYFPQERHRALLGIALYTMAGVIGWAYSPSLALLIFLALPVFYGITSEGLTETRLGLLLRRRSGL
jgi:uncharacterized membrane protein